MVRRASPWLLASVLLSACGEPPPPPPPPPGVVAPNARPAAATTPSGQPGQPTVTPTIDSNFGTVTLATGFQPDPHVERGTSGGDIDARTFQGDCRGFVTQKPDHVLVATTAFQRLRILVNAGESDVTLVVQAPGGGYSCSDDAEGRNPIVELGGAQGTYRIWVGSYQAGQQSPYVMGFSELADTTAAGLPLGNGAGSLATDGTASNFGTIALAPGFTPDPRTVQGTSGGEVDLGPLGVGCRGFVTPQPDHILELGGDSPSLCLMVRSEGDTVLLVHRPDGSFVCDDDTEGRNPVVTGAFPKGTYRLWVGSYQPRSNDGYVLGITQIADVMPSTLAAP